MLPNLEIWLQGEPGVLRKAEFKHHLKNYYCRIEERDSQPEYYDTLEQLGIGRGSTLQAAFEDAVKKLRKLTSLLPSEP